MRQIVVGMSGHIDHGKTSIVKSLTGLDTQRHSEEVDRGMTIDIGFAFLSDKITIIDVPGHEKFIKNMMAGSCGIDIAILVIAADDGIMPQTREHLEILKLLKIQKGIIVLNKVDLVDEEWIELVLSDIKETVKNTFLEKSDIVKVSTVTEFGIEILKKKIIDSSKLIDEKESNGHFKMAVDRVFTMKGFGTIATGTISSGLVRTNQNVEILPGNKKTKVRGLQTHLNPVEEVRVGDRAAINLQNISLDEISRGSILAECGCYRLVSDIGVILNVLDSSNFDIHQNQRVRFHIGTNEVMARISLTNDKILKAGERGPAMIKLEKPIVASYKERFIIRLFSPVTTIGGGEIIDIDIKGKWKDIKKHMNSIFSDNEYSMLSLISKYGINPLKKADFSRLFDMSEEQILDLLRGQSKIINVIYKNYDWILVDSQDKKNNDKVLSLIKDFHKKYKYRPGISREEVTQLSDSDSNYINYIIDKLIDKGEIEKKNNVISLSGYEYSLSDSENKIMDKLFEILNDEGFSSSDYSELAKKLSQNPESIKLLLNIMEYEKRIIRLDGNLMFTNKNFNMLKNNVIKYFDKSDSLSINEFKNIASTSRKYAIPLLEFFDKLKITTRKGNLRKLSNAN